MISQADDAIRAAEAKFLANSTKSQELIALSVPSVTVSRL